MSGFENTPLGGWGKEQEKNEEKPLRETIQYNYLTISIDRRREDGVIEIRVQGSSDPTEFSVSEGKIISGSVEHFSSDVDQKADNELLAAHARTINELIADGKI